MNQPKVLMINHEKCTGCRRCELVCSVFHERRSKPVQGPYKGREVGMGRALYPHVLPAVRGCAVHERLPGEGHLPG